MNTWISVKEKLPGAQRPVLVFHKKEILVAHYYYTDEEAEWCEYTVGADELPHVTHWQELPKPPEIPEDKHFAVLLSTAKKDHVTSFTVSVTETTPSEKTIEATNISDVSDKVKQQLEKLIQTIT